MNTNNAKRAELGIDGNCGYALLGQNLQEGEAEFVEIVNTGDELADQLRAAKGAFRNLQSRLNAPEMSFYFGPSHPYGG